jgi:four helix bundle protein
MPTLDYEKLDVYHAALDFVSYVHTLCSGLRGNHRFAKDQLLRASLSIPLNVAEGNGKRSHGERRRFFEIARGSSMECAAVLDVLRTTDGCSQDQANEGKTILYRVVAMLTRMVESPQGHAREGKEEYG